MKSNIQSAILLRDGLAEAKSERPRRRSAAPARPAPILRPGRNVWRVERSTRAAFLVDSQCYFRWLEQALRLARRSIWILAWDFNGKIRLRPDSEDCQETLGELLRSLVERRPGLEVRILVWSIGPIYSGRSIRLFRNSEWAEHPRIHIRYDPKHPLRGSHHQKVVCIDDSVAFAGGIDLTAKRWDTCEHLPDLAARIAPDDLPYTPVHDVQMAVEGDAARALGDLCRARWRVATGEEIPATPRSYKRWPAGLKPDLEGTDVAIARTQSWVSGRRERREAFELNRDALMSARRHIYIETQYFASPAVAEVLERRLQEPNGPDVVILVTNSARGWLEGLIMGGNRDRLIRRLKRADRYGRLRVMYAAIPYEDGSECEILIHSKVLIIDDTFARIGSSNLNNRSEGLDTECDLAIEVHTEAERRAIASLRDRLVGEHVGEDPETVAQVLRAEGSLVRTIDRLNINPRSLRPIPVDVKNGATAQLPGTGFLDPREPYWPLQKLRNLFSFLTRSDGGS